MGSIGKCCCSGYQCLCDAAWNLSGWKIDDLWGFALSASFEPATKDKTDPQCWRRGLNYCNNRSINNIVKTQTITSDWSSPVYLGYNPAIQACDGRNEFVPNCSSGSYVDFAQDYTKFSFRISQRMYWYASLEVSAEVWAISLSPTTFYLYAAVFYFASFYQVLTRREQGRVRVERRTCSTNTLVSDTDWLMNFTEIDLTEPLLTCNSSDIWKWPFPRNPLGCPPNGIPEPTGEDCGFDKRYPIEIERLNFDCELVPVTSSGSSDLSGFSLQRINNGGPVNFSAQDAFYDTRYGARIYNSAPIQCDGIPAEVELESIQNDQVVGPVWGSGEFNIFTPPAALEGGKTIPKKIWVKIS